MRPAMPSPSVLVENATAGLAPEVVDRVRVSDTQLYLDGVSVSFDGFRAINNLALMVAPGELRTIIGPNGAGKTTMMDIITGKTKPDAGEVLFAGRIDLTKLDEVAIANLGIGRKFQKPTVFENLTVFENFELALKSARGSLEDTPRPPEFRSARPHCLGARYRRAGYQGGRYCRFAQPWPEAVARDRHAAGAGHSAHSAG